MTQDKRLFFRVPIQYEKDLGAGQFDIPVTVSARDIGSNGVSLYCQDKMGLGDRVRIVFPVGEHERITCTGKVMSIEISDEPAMAYVVGIQFERMGENERARLDAFLQKIDMYAVVESIRLEGAVDINFIAGFPPVVKRIDGLTVEHGQPLDEYVLKILLHSLLDRDRYKKFIAEKELNFVYTHNPSIRFRANLHVQQGKTEGTFRLIPQKVKNPSELGLPKSVEKLLENKKGLILIAGRTGSGKTTTLSSMVNCINRIRSGIVICIEDPVEYIHTNNKCIIKQREIGRDTLSFSAAARNALRQNPDVLVIGEILDMETMDVAITAAETGALVLATIHAGNCTQAVDRAMNFFPPEAQRNVLGRLGLVLRGVITQMLIPRVDEKGLIVAAEVLIATDPVKKIIRTGDWKSIPTFIQTGKSAGMQTMHDALEFYYQQSMIGPEYLLEEAK